MTVLSSTINQWPQDHSSLSFSLYYKTRYGPIFVSFPLAKNIQFVVLFLPLEAHLELFFPFSSVFLILKVQNQIDEKTFTSSTSCSVMEKPINQEQVPFKCPRCESINTKFCYYNNYSLSQPRHFCKACKRYWTRGGTLRNVPVGGAFRKNKRVKRPPQTSTATGVANPSSVPNETIVQSKINHVNPSLYSLPTNPIELNLSYSRSNSPTVWGFDMHSQINGLGLEFLSARIASDRIQHINDCKNMFNSAEPIQDIVINPSTLLSRTAIFGSSTFASTSTMASLLASSLQQQNIVSTDLKDIQESNNFPVLSPLADIQNPGNGLMGKAINPIEHMNFSDLSHLWNTTGVGTWVDPSNMGSSVPSLI